MKLKTILALPLLVLLSGCSTNHFVNLKLHYITADSAPVQAVDHNAQSQLAEAATSAGHSLQELSAIQMASQPHDKFPAPINPNSIGMAQQTSLNWTGPVEALLKKVAKASHYRVRVLGKAPAIPVIVVIDEKNVPLAQILRDARYQIVKKAKIAIYPSQKIIELRYYQS